MSLSQVWEVYLSIVANALTAIGIGVIGLYWFYQRRVKIQIIVPNISDANYKMLFVREGGDGTKLVNKTVSFKDVAIINETEKIISIKIRCNPRLGFQFKCFVELLGTDKQNRTNYKILKKKLLSLEFKDISPLAYDGKVWYLLPHEYLFGQINISPLESIKNNIWYPTLAKKIYPYHSIKLKVPIKCEGENVFDENEYVLETTTNNQKEIIYFKLLESNENENYALIKASIQLTEKLSEVKYRFFLETLTDDTERIMNLLNNATNKKSEQLDVKIKDGINEFLEFRNNKGSISNLREEEEIDIAMKLRKIIKNGNAEFIKNIKDNALKSFENELQTIIEINSKKITSSEYMKHLFELIESYNRDYDIKNMKIDKAGSIIFMVDEVVNLNGNNYEYFWNAQMLKKKWFF